MCVLYVRCVWMQICSERCEAENFLSIEWWFVTSVTMIISVSKYQVTETWARSNVTTRKVAIKQKKSLDIISKWYFIGKQQHFPSGLKGGRQKKLIHAEIDIVECAHLMCRYSLSGCNIKKKGKVLFSWTSRVLYYNELSPFGLDWRSNVSLCN